MKRWGEVHFTPFHSNSRGETLPAHDVSSETDLATQHYMQGTRQLKCSPKFRQVAKV